MYAHIKCFDMFESTKKETLKHQCLIKQDFDQNSSAFECVCVCMFYVIV